jgi:hypothetical protein
MRGGTIVWRDKCVEGQLCGGTNGWRDKWEGSQESNAGGCGQNSSGSCSEMVLEGQLGGQPGPRRGNCGHELFRLLFRDGIGGSNGRAASTPAIAAVVPSCCNKLGEIWWWRVKWEGSHNPGEYGRSSELFGRSSELFGKHCESWQGRMMGGRVESGRRVGCGVIGGRGES